MKCLQSYIHWLSECTSNGHCTKNEKSICDTNSNVCVGKMKIKNHKQIDKRFGTSFFSNSFSECTSSSHCTQNERNICDTGLGVCVGKKHN